jgi:hypothetical protein
MRRAALLLALFSAALTAVFVTAFMAARTARPSAAATAQSLIDAYRCDPAETRHVIWRGAEDAYSPAGLEKAGRHPRLQDLDLDTPHPAVDYDSPAPDSTVIDYFEFPPRTASAMIAIKMRAVGDNSNDNIIIGDFSTIPKGKPKSEHRVYTGLLNSLPASGWLKSGDLHSASLADLPLDGGGAVIDLLKGGGNIVDLLVRDDTSVDFAAAVACAAPAEHKGASFVAAPTLAAFPDLALFNCHRFTPGGGQCDPLAGDKPCESALPLLCFLDRGLAAPVGSPSAEFDILTRDWSGGEVAATAPVRGDSFKTIADADRFCAAQFGLGWRVAEFHLSGRGWSFAAKSGGRRFSGEYWIDVRGAPHGTCWARNHE